MKNYIDRVRRPLRTIFVVLIVFAIVRLAFGLAVILFLNDDGLAYGLRATAILALATLVGVSVALFYRRSPNNEHPTAND